MTQWIRYFLMGLAETAQKASETLSNVLVLKARIENEINQKLGRKSHTATILLNYLFQKPIVHVREVEEATGLSYKAANVLVADFMSLGILKEMTGQSRNRVFVMAEYVDLF